MEYILVFPIRMVYSSELLLTNMTVINEWHYWAVEYYYEKTIIIVKKLLMTARNDQYDNGIIINEDYYY